jgi:hypothetical protein
MTNAPEVISARIYRPGFRENKRKTGSINSGTGVLANTPHPHHETRISKDSGRITYKDEESSHVGLENTKLTY